ncbi:MAG TPA: GTPase [Alphaproteobacteria bacterium]|nr:GTPase [Alphaproteobacteria bacterium]
MRLKSFHGSSLTDAMRLVRESLGENAIIVATRDDEMGGVRVTAAIDELTATTTATPAQPDGSEAIEIIAEALMRHQVPQHLAERLLATATQFANDDPVLALGAAFDAHFQFAPIIDDKLEKPLVLIGPPGAGKTLTTAKFATKATLSKRSVTVISTDIERAGGMEQLAAFTRLLKLNLVEIEDAHALRDAVVMQKGATVFIDTPGRNPFNAVERQQVHNIVTAAGGEATLVMPTGMDADEALDMAHEFRACGANRLLVTRVDMTKRLGSFLHIAFDAHLPLANYSASEKVTEPPTPFNPVTLARLILPRPAKSEQATGTHS